MLSYHRVREAKCPSFLEFRGRMGFCDCQRPCSTSRDNVAIRLKHPLGHLIAFSLCRAKYPSKYFFVEGELLCVITVVAPFISTKLAKTRYVAFITCQYSVWILSMQVEGVFCCHVVDSCASLSTVIPESRGAVGVLHIFSDCLLD